ncbi:uncharacterized protein LOC124807840 isoform X1 [Hydra vulgaris]|uniref:uncharacterized protein LOC124807840 isoform X1 n=1 Tax=Hydra vulgaris TaxID=6087 RepID=UPI001F5E3F60|nr:uncharacterized protein LOC124807840 [Hydra vulgaris]XP_047126305.1 uncharacterized protein LOC124807840 [Hydra vulgaris]
MTIKTIIMFSLSGPFAVAFANKARGWHILRNPHVHVLCSLFGISLGMWCSNFEDTFDDRMRENYKENPTANNRTRESLLVFQNIMKQREENKILFEADKKNFDISEAEEDSE